MKANINGTEIEGTPEEVAQLLKLMDGVGGTVITYVPTYIPQPLPYFDPYEKPWITWGKCDTAGTSDNVAWYKCV